MDPALLNKINTLSLATKVSNNSNQIIVSAYATPTSQAPIIEFKENDSEVLGHRDIKRIQYSDESRESEEIFNELDYSEEVDLLEAQSLFLPSLDDRVEGDLFHKRKTNNFSNFKRGSLHRLSRIRQHSSKMSIIGRHRGENTSMSDTGKSTIGTSNHLRGDLTFFRERRGEIHLSVCPQGNFRSALRENSCVKGIKRDEHKRETKRFLRASEFDDLISKKFNSDQTLYQNDWIGSENNVHDQWLKRANRIHCDN